jgi:predicted RNA binding protein YcfA (HicA-like mRNA interferase family)
MPKLPQVSGESVLRLLRSLGYETVRQKGSHVTVRLEVGGVERSITVPMHRVVAKGTLSDILSEAGVCTGVSREELVRQLG